MAVRWRSGFVLFHLLVVTCLFFVISYQLNPTKYLLSNPTKHPSFNPTKHPSFNPTKHKNFVMKVQNLNNVKCKYEPYYNKINKLIDFKPFKKSIESFGLKFNKTFCDPKLKDPFMLQKLIEHLFGKTEIKNEIKLVSICDCEINWNNDEPHKYMYQVLKQLKNICHTNNKILPNIVFLLFLGDGDLWPMYKDYKYATFQTEGSIQNLATISSSNYGLLLPPRSYYLHFFNRNKIEYYLNKTKYFPKWDERNHIAIFRGGASGRISGSFLHNDYKSPRFDYVKYFYTGIGKDIIDIKFVKCKWTHCENMPEEYIGERVTENDEMNNKFIITIDGNSVTDRLPRQLLYGSVILKQRSNNIEFWYYHLKNWKNFVEFKSPKDLNKIINEWNANGAKISQNGVKLIQNHYNENVMDCFSANMIHYFAEQYYEA